MLRKSFRRALTTVAVTPVVAGILIAGAPAAMATHDVLPTCDPASSTRLYTGEVGGIAGYVWLQAISSDASRICIGVEPDDLVIDLDTGLSFSLPSVTNTPGTGNCGIEVADIDDPAAFQLSFNWTLTPSICIGMDDKTSTLRLNGVSVTNTPNVTVWRGGGGWVDLAACAVQYANYLSGGSYTTYYNCYNYPARIV